MSQVPSSSESVPAPQTPPSDPAFDFDAFPADTLFFDRRTATPPDEPGSPPAPARPKKERRRRIDPTTFEKQYTPEEIAFMKAMQRFKDSTGKPFPTHGEVLRVVRDLGYEKDAEG
jgi:hypothetical protein